MGVLVAADQVSLVGIASIELDSVVLTRFGY
jgi:hypothetical protein